MVLALVFRQSLRPAESLEFGIDALLPVAVPVSLLFGDGAVNGFIIIELRDDFILFLPIVVEVGERGGKVLRGCRFGYVSRSLWVSGLPNTVRSYVLQCF